MSSEADQHLICEQCGAALPSPDAHCLSCMLTGGMESTEPATTTPETLTGTRFYQHYQIQTRADGSEWELGRGAMGVTYKALDVNLQVPVALKVINARYSSQSEARARFLREARAAARLRHPNVASVFHYGTLERADQSGAIEECFYAMEFVEGETLEARVQRDGPLPRPRARDCAPGRAGTRGRGKARTDSSRPEAVEHHARGGRADPAMRG